MYSTCEACTLRFTGVTAFDAHRVGVFEECEEQGKGKRKAVVVLRRSRRRCLAEPEMRAKGMVPNDKGVWGFPRTEASVAYFQGLRPPKQPDEKEEEAS